MKHAAIYDGEAYDARETECSQCQVSGSKCQVSGSKCQGDGLLSVPEENDEFRGEILPSDGAEVYQRPAPLKTFPPWE